MCPKRAGHGQVCPRAHCLIVTRACPFRPEEGGMPSEERAAELRPMARKAIDASLELADELEAA